MKTHINAALIIGGVALLLALPLAVTEGRAGGASRTVILATTTSTQDSGLLDVLVPMFEKKTGYTVKTIAVGTGQSLAMGARGDADVVLVHAPALELKYMKDGSMIYRRLVMHNDFILIGPPTDPAKVRGMARAVEALKRIRETKAPFVSRGDNSGTNILEKKLWKEAGIEPHGDWYLQSGQGMGATLTIASEKRAYTISDRGTYLAFKRQTQLDILVEKDARLLNVYHVMEVNPARFSRVNHQGGRAFADFMVSPEAQDVIQTFGVEKYGQPLFFPDAGKPEAALGG